MDCSSAGQGSYCNGIACSCFGSADCTASSWGTVCQSSAGGPHCGCNTLSDCTGASAYPGGCCPTIPGKTCMQYGASQGTTPTTICKNGSWVTAGESGAPCTPQGPCNLGYCCNPGYCCDMTQPVSGASLFGVCSSSFTCSGGQCGSNGYPCCSPGNTCGPSLTCKGASCSP
jgi:hypothetical protein